MPNTKRTAPHPQPPLPSVGATATSNTRQRHLSSAPRTDSDANLAAASSSASSSSAILADADDDDSQQQQQQQQPASRRVLPGGSGGPGLSIAITDPRIMGLQTDESDAGDSSSTEDDRAPMLGTHADATTPLSALSAPPLFPGRRAASGGGGIRSRPPLPSWGVSPLGSPARAMSSPTPSLHRSSYRGTPATTPGLAPTGGHDGDDDSPTSSPNDKYLDADVPDADWADEGGGRRVKYEDFTTIDWIHDFAKERVRLKRLRKHASTLANLWDASQAWILVALVGIFSGVIATFIALVEEWLGDLKQGYCSDQWYLNRKFCCWMQSEEDCPAWVGWGERVVPGHVKHGEGEPANRFLAAYGIYICVATLFSFMAAFMCKNLAPYAAGSGIPEVKTILGGFIMRKFLGAWTLLVKVIGLPLATASGMSLGKEGPFVHVSCAIGNILPRMFTKFAKNEAKKREILSAAAAAGISSAFGSPIGGVLFSLEEVSYYFPFKTMLRSFFAAMCAAVTLQVLNPYRTGKLVLFQVTYDTSWHSFELIFFILIGVLGGLFGAFFIRANIRIIAIRKFSWLKRHPIQEACAIAFVTAIVSYLNTYLRMSTDKLIGALFRECDGTDEMMAVLCDRSMYGTTAWVLAVAAVVKLALTIVTFGIRVPCGCFVPTMAIGACVGRVLGMAVDALQQAYPSFFFFSSCVPDVECVTIGPYALLGAAAFLAGITRMTVSLVIIIFEVSGALTYVVPVMISVMVSKFVADAFGKESIYDALIRLNEYPFLCPKEEYVESVNCGQVMTSVSDLIVLPATEATVGDLEQVLRDYSYKGFPVVASTKTMHVVGFINRNELRYALEQAKRRPTIDEHTPCYFSGHLPAMPSSPAATILSFGSTVAHAVATAAHFVDLSSWMDQTPMTLVPRTPMEMVIELFKKVGLRYVLVTKNGALIGLITKKDA
ncbi:chloride channel, partial [Catenaria anguillulae PL171]